MLTESSGEKGFISREKSMSSFINISHAFLLNVNGIYIAFEISGDELRAQHSIRKFTVQMLELSGQCQTKDESLQLRDKFSQISGDCR